ncbi:MAG: glycosyl transferase, partial [Gemmatimonadota bacterium]|nr:glycosyl transferase [Gemmatimonadota bacterium]
MSDFYQHGHIATLHRLGDQSLEMLERRIITSVRHRPVALVIPVTLEDSRQKTFDKILKVVAGVPYLKHVVVTTGQVKKLEDFTAICRKVKAKVPGAIILWSSGPRLGELADRMIRKGLPVSRKDGKGRSVWFAYGYVFARGDCRVIALHDADIVNYDRELLGRLCFPVVSRIHTYEF